MTASIIIKTVLEILAVIGLGIAVYHEEEIAQFERMAAKYVKCFFLACYYYAKEKLREADKHQKKGQGKVIQINSASESSRVCRSSGCSKSKSKSA